MKIRVAFPLMFAMLTHGVWEGPDQASKPAGILGTWEGESTCKVVNSPCHNENVICEISPGESGKLKFDAFKVVSGEKEFMGTLDCQLNTQTLSCAFRGRPKDDWEFSIRENSMDGKLWVGEERTLYREIRLKRQTKHP